MNQAGRRAPRSSPHPPVHNSASERIEVVNKSPLRTLVKEKTRVGPVTNFAPIHAMDDRRCSNRNEASEIETNTQDVGRSQASTIRLSQISDSRVTANSIQKEIDRNNRETAPVVEEYAALIGVDWADEKHDVWIWEVATGESQHRVGEHTPEALAEWLAELQARYPGQRVALCLEQSRGALIYALMGHAFLTLYPIHPVTLSRYREAFSPSRAKDDPGDAKVLSEILRLHRDKLSVWKPDDEQTRTFTFLNEERRKAVDLRTKLVFRLQAALKLYFPQALEWVGIHRRHPLACAFLLKWPTLETLQKAPPETIRAFYYAHHCRRSDQIEEYIKAIATAKPLTQNPAVIAANRLTVQRLAKQLRTLHGSIAEYDRQIARLFAPHPDAFIFDSLPGAGTALAPRLLSAFGTDRDRHPAAKDMQTYAGIAPVIERSGKSCWTHWRWNCPKFLRQTFPEFAKNSIPYSTWAKAYYELQKQRGKGHNAAIRSLAFKWIRALHRCWKDRQPYDENQYLQALQQHGSELISLIAQQPQKA
jgi:transposase